MTGPSAGGKFDPAGSGENGDVGLPGRNSAGGADRSAARSGSCPPSEEARTPVYSGLGRHARRIYLALPAGRRAKLLAKDAIFLVLSPFIRHTRAYKAWKKFRFLDGRPAWVSVSRAVSRQSLARYVADLLERSDVRHGAERVEIASIAIPSNSLVDKLIAFYEPHFSAASQCSSPWQDSSAWVWIARAVPQFVGHYQPHLPGDLGFYAPGAAEVIREQVRLARLYGVHGFCFHYYWSPAKTVANRSLQQYMASELHGMPFCICWANEESQSHADSSASDMSATLGASEHRDAAFIRDAEHVLLHPDYLRIGGRPLLIISRPALVPRLRELLQRWRDYFRESRHGELFLAMLQRDDEDPREYGFDAAIEFPPYSLTGDLAPLNGRLQIVNPNYDGRVVDSGDILKRASSRQVPPYDLFRGIFPMWDNEARHPGAGYTVAHSTPAHYRRWLACALEYAREHPVQGERMVFVNAWNAWMDGAHLEPDSRHGYAYLQATREVLQRHAAQSAGFFRVSPSPMGAEPAAPVRVCVVIHAFYPELLAEILALLDGWTLPYRIVVTTVQDRVAQVEAVLQGVEVPVEVVVVENHGRDILPFLRVAASLVDVGERLILKLHTKRSLHRTDGNAWRRDMLYKLADKTNAERIFRAFKDNGKVGLVAPDGHVLPMSANWKANADRVRFLCDCMGIASAELESEAFAAGSMFYIRTEALRPLLDMRFDPSEFEGEAGQVDGTLAHAIERCFSIVARNSGFLVTQSGKPAQPARPSNDSQHSDG